MATVIILSSSPPRVFADPPTEADTSSPKLPSSSALLDGTTSSPKKFKTKNGARIGFGNGFASAKSLLSEKIGGENAPLRSPGKEKFKALSQKARASKIEQSQQLDVVAFPTRWNILPSESSNEHGRSQLSAELSVSQGRTEHNQPTMTSVPAQYDNTEDGARLPAEEAASLIPEKATARRLDWTPAKEKGPPPNKGETEAIEGKGFDMNLISSFAFAADVSSVPTKQDADQAPLKRRRLDMLESHSDIPFVQSASPDRKRKSRAKSAVPKKVKAPPKKNLTITGLATSLYLGQDDKDTASPLMQYLTSTQAGAVEDNGSLVSEVALAKAAKNKSKIRKSAKTTKSRLLSPTSVIKSLTDQDLIFGSASQLARDESPTLLRDTIAATIQSESFMFSDPISPQRTQPISMESTTPRPAKGTARFTRTRNLWAAAGRDENNALLHVETVDMFDTPSMRLAFAGTDILTEPAAHTRRSNSPKMPGLSLRGGLGLADIGHALLDIDDITTPVRHRSPTKILQSRALHTTTSTGSPSRKAVAQRAAGEAPPAGVAPSTRMSKEPPANPKKPVPAKPAYVGYSDFDLKKQVTAYGFKPIKKREKMIELLDRCWDEKYGSKTDADTAPQGQEDATTTLKHGDFLSNVHAISARPVPKVKKPPRKKNEKDDSFAPKERKTRKKKVEDGETAPKPVNRRKKAEPDPNNPEAAAKTTKRRKESEADPNDPEAAAKPIRRRKKGDSKPDDGGEGSSKTAAKTPRKRKAKASALSEELVVDVDDIEAPKVSINVPSNAPEVVTADDKAMLIPEPPQRLSTPPLTLPATIPIPSSPILDIFDLPPSNQEAASSASPASSSFAAPSVLPDMSTQVKRAIAFDSTNPPTHAHPSRNHQKNPTWHEKILLYDPIILEDLTIWLNTEGLSKIGEDREVSAHEVRAWCEKEGICCLWKGGWRGNKGKVTVKGDAEED